MESWVHVLADRLLAPLLFMFDPLRRVYWVYLGGALLIAVAVYLHDRRRSGPPGRRLAAYLFPKQIYRHRSTRIDYWFFYVNAVLGGLVLAPLVGAPAVAGVVAQALGGRNPALEPGLPASIGVQVAHPDALVIDIAGEASVQMTMQEMSTAVQHDLPIKIFILNNQYMGMVRQWQELLHGNRLSHSYMDSLPDFVKLAEAYGCVGIRAEKPAELDDAIAEMINVKRPVLFDCRVAALANCFPMIPSGKAHNEMLLGEDVTAENIGSAIGAEGKVLV